MTDYPTCPPPPGLRKWQQLEHLSEMKWGGKQKWRREREREGEEKRKAAWAADGWTVFYKAPVEVNIVFRLNCDFSQWAVAWRPQRSQCEGWGSWARRRFSSYCPADWLQPEFLLTFLHSKNAMECWLLGCWIPKQTFFLKKYTKRDVDLKLMVEVGIKENGFKRTLLR